MRRAPCPALARPTPGRSGLACRRLLLLGVLRSFDFPFTGPVLAEQFAGMLGAAGAVAAAHRFRRAIAVATPADAQLLESNLAAAKAKDAEVRVQLQADEGVNYGQVAKAMASIERAGITRLAVITAR